MLVFARYKPYSSVLQQIHKFRVSTWYTDATSCRQLGKLILLLPMLKGTFCLESVSTDFGSSFRENACISNQKQTVCHVNTPW
jgi:hypothetical protein